MFSFPDKCPQPCHNNVYSQNCTSTLYWVSRAPPTHSLPNMAIADVNSDMKTVIMAGIDMVASSAPLK